MAQAEMVRAALEPWLSSDSIELVGIDSTGDKRRTGSAPAVEDKKEWIYELEQALVRGEVDCVVHSGKDVPSDLEPQTAIYPVMGRASAEDIMLSKHSYPDGASFQEYFPKHGRVGTSSIRRKAQLLALRPDIEVIECRGNVPTRLEKLYDTESYDALVLAKAALYRLDIEPPAQLLLPSEFIPAVNQGILVAQSLVSRPDVERLLTSIVLNDVLAAFQAERSFVSFLGADCRSALGVKGTVEGSELSLSAMVLSQDGTTVLRDEERGLIGEALNLGQTLALRMIAQGAMGLLRG